MAESQLKRWSEGDVSHYGVPLKSAPVIRGKWGDVKLTGRHIFVRETTFEGYGRGDANGPFSRNHLPKPLGYVASMGNDAYAELSIYRGGRMVICEKVAECSNKI